MSSSKYHIVASFGLSDLKATKIACTKTKRKSIMLISLNCRKMLKQYIHRFMMEPTTTVLTSEPIIECSFEKCWGGPGKWGPSLHGIHVTPQISTEFT